MRLITAGSDAAFACAAADFTAAVLQAKPDAVLALPTGNTPRGLYAELVGRSREGRCSLRSARVFNLDEFLGVSPNDPNSYAAFVDRHLVAPLALSPDRVRLLQGDASDPEAECRAYDAAIEACGGIDLCILGLGANGHIAFNEPGDAWNLRTHCVELSATTRAAQQPARKGEGTDGASPGGSWVCPTHGLTLGILSLLEARQVLLLIAGTNKQAARDSLMRGNANPAWPVTSLLAHPDLTVIELS